MGQNMLDAHFGLGDANAVDSITVSWPSGEVQHLTGVPTDQVINIVEP